MDTVVRLAELGIAIGFLGFITRALLERLQEFGLSVESKKRGLTGGHSPGL